jgi:hypothetical protein
MILKVVEGFAGCSGWLDDEVGDEGWSSMSGESRVSIAGELSLSRILGGINTTINYQTAD